MNISPVKLFSELLVNLNVLVPVLQTFLPAYGFAGAVVFVPKCNIPPITFVGLGIVNVP